MKIGTAEKYLEQAHAQNPGAWKQHSIYVALAAQTIALRSRGKLDEQKAYIYGLLHDIGRGRGISGLRHVWDGMLWAERLGYPDIARICLTHSFPLRRIDEFIGEFDLTAAERSELEQRLSGMEYDDYDRLIQLCDALGSADGLIGLEKRMEDVAKRYGLSAYPPEKKAKYRELQRYFEELCGEELDPLLREAERRHRASGRDFPSVLDGEDKA